MTYIRKEVQYRMVVLLSIFFGLGLLCLISFVFVKKPTTKHTMLQSGLIFGVPPIPAGIFLILSRKMLSLVELAPVALMFGVTLTILLAHMEVFQDMNTVLRQ